MLSDPQEHLTLSKADYYSCHEPDIEVNCSDELKLTWPCEAAGSLRFQLYIHADPS